MSALSVVDEIHLVIAFLIVLCALILGWVQTGRRVMTAIIGFQVLVGIIYAALLGGALHAVGGRIGEHILGALLAMAAYIIGRRLALTSKSSVAPIVFSCIGLVLVILTAYLGLKMYGRIA